MEAPMPTTPSCSSCCSSKNKFLCILGAALLAALVGISAYLYGQKSVVCRCDFPTPFAPETTPAPEITAIRDETASWKIYTNKLLNYSLKYPLDWDKLEADNGNYVRFFEGAYSPNLPTPQVYISILAKANPSRKSLQEWLQNENLLPAKEDIHNQVENITIDGIEGIKIFTNDNGGQSTIYLPNKDTILQITYIFKGEDIKEYDVLVKIFDQILSTLKFLN